MSSFALLPAFTFATGALAVWAAGRLRDYQPDPRGMVDLLPWQFLVKDEPLGIVLNKSGSFTAALRLSGPDRASSTDADLNRLVEAASLAFSHVADSWTFHFNAVRRPASAYPPPGQFPDPVSAFLDDRRRAAYLSAGALFETETILSVTFRPLPEVYQHVLLRFQKGVRKEERTWRDTMARFELDLEFLASKLSAAVRVRPLKGAELLSPLYNCVTCKDQPIAVPGHGVYLDQVLSTEHATGGWEPSIGDQHLSLLSISHLPGRSLPAMLSDLSDAPYPFRFCVRFTPLTSHTASAIIARYTRGWSWMQRSARDIFFSDGQASQPSVYHNRFAQEMLEDAADATALATQGLHRFCYFTATLVLHSPSRTLVDERSLEMAKFLADRGITLRRESFNAVAAFHGSLPGEDQANLRAPLVNALPASDLLLLTTLWSGHRRHPCAFFDPESPPILVGRTRGATPFRLHLHTGDLGHTIIVGPPGAGKSTHLTALVAGWLRYPNSKVYLFDRDHSSRLLALALQSAYYDLGEDDLGFQPLRHIDTPAQRAVVLSWLDALFSVSLPSGRLSPKQSVNLSEALDLVTPAEPAARQLELLRDLLRDGELQQALTPFVDGPYGAYLTSTHDPLKHDKRLQVFEMRRLLDLEPRIHLPILHHILNRIEEGLDGSPTLLVLDEAGLALLHHAFASRITQWALTLRKKNVALVMAFQALTQLDGNGAFATLLQSCPTRIFLPNPDAVSPSIRPVYEACGLNPAQIDLIASAHKKQDYYLVNPDGAAFYGLSLTPTDLAFMGTLPGFSLQETHASMFRHIEQHGARWPVAWLRSCGLAEDAARLETQLNLETL